MITTLLSHLYLYPPLTCLIVVFVLYWVFLSLCCVLSAFQSSIVLPPLTLIPLDLSSCLILDRKQPEAIRENFAKEMQLFKEDTSRISSDCEKAEKMSAQLVKNNPKNTAYLDTHAWVLFMREKYKEARKYMEKAIEFGDVSATHYEHYGDILFQLGNIDEAVKQWQKAKSMDQGNELIDKKIANKRLN